MKKRSLVIVTIIVFFICSLYGNMPLQRLRQLAEGGDAKAQYFLGERYFRGEKGVAQNYREAAKWYRLAAEQNNAMAQASLGYMYYDGIGVIQNYQEAAKWYRLAAEQGDAPSQGMLGVMYGEGFGVIKNYERSYFWLLLACANADVNMFRLYSEGRDIVVKRLTPSQRTRIQREAQEWLNSK